MDDEIKMEEAEIRLADLAAVPTRLGGALVEGDPDEAMALGPLAVSEIQGYSCDIVLLPAFARPYGWSLFIVWLTFWACALTLALGDDAGLILGIFPLALSVTPRWQGGSLKLKAMDHRAA